MDQRTLRDVQKNRGREATRWEGRASPSTTLDFRPWAVAHAQWGDQVLTFDHQGNMIPWVHPTEIPLQNPSFKGTPLLGPWCWAKRSKASLAGLLRSWHPLGLGPSGLSISQA